MELKNVDNWCDHKTSLSLRRHEKHFVLQRSEHFYDFRAERMMSDLMTILRNFILFSFDTSMITAKKNMLSAVHDIFFVIYHQGLRKINSNRQWQRLFTQFKHKTEEWKWKMLRQREKNYCFLSAAAKVLRGWEKNVKKYSKFNKN